MVTDGSWAVLCDWFNETQTDRGADKQIFPAAINFLCADLVIWSEKNLQISKLKHVDSSECL